jgi:tetratricopeptide (TPR) repeat protein
MEKAQMLFEKGTSLLKEGDWARASEAFKEAISVIEGKASTDEEKAFLSRLLRRKAQADSRMSELDQAEKDLEHALKVSMSIEDKKGVADAFRGLGYVHILRGEARTSMENYKKASEAAEGTDDIDLIGRIRLEIGNVHHFLKEYDKAKEHYTRAVLILKTVDDKNELCRAYNNLGETHLRLGDFEEGIEILRQCMDLATKIGDRTIKGWAAFNIAECFAHVGETDTAKQYLQVGMMALERSKDRIGMAYALIVYGKTFLIEEDHVHAEEALTRSIDLTRELKMPLLEAQALSMLAEVDIARGRKDEARKGLRNVLGIYEEKGWVGDAEEARKKIKGL